MPGVGGVATSGASEVESTYALIVESAVGAIEDGEHRRLLGELELRPVGRRDDDDAIRLREGGARECVDLLERDGRGEAKREGLLVGDAEDGRVVERARHVLRREDVRVGLVTLGVALLERAQVLGAGALELRAP